MTRPDDRPLRRLPALEPRKATLERCVFCPKLCRSACPVSNAEPRETITPWGKMSMAYFVANESVPAEPAYAAPAWACTGCFGCKEHCDHDNDVTGTLFEARSALAEVAPEAAKRALAQHDEKAAVLGKSKEALSVLPEVNDSSSTAVLLGCMYARAGTEARDAVRAVAKLTGGPVSIVARCCGAPLLYAGDRARFDRASAAFADAVASKERVVVVDPGCASTIRLHSANKTKIIHFTELAAEKLDVLSEAPIQGVVRYHDPCQLGRGLGIYDQPRALLTKALGRAPDEFDRNREDARCSGAGGLLPLTMPETSQAMAKSRVAETDGTIVTACASSRRAFEKAGANTVDLVTVVARALGVAEP